MRARVHKKYLREMPYAQPTNKQNTKQHIVKKLVTRSQDTLDTGEDGGKTTTTNKPKNENDCHSPRLGWGDLWVFILKQTVLNQKAETMTWKTGKSGSQDWEKLATTELAGPWTTPIFIFSALIVTDHRSAGTRF